MNRRAMGAMGEARAAKALEDMGYAILAKNYRKRSGEIDLIAMQGDTLAFIEVKARTTARYGQPAEAVTPLKQRRIAETAMAYIAENGLDDVPCRFDVVEVFPDGVRVLRGAFDASARD